MLAVACTDYAHTNPYDPAVPKVITISGPDTIFNFGDTAIYAATMTPAVADSALHFVDSYYLTSIGATGTAIVTNKKPPIFPLLQAFTIFVHFGALDTVMTLSGALISVPTITYRDSALRTIYLTQRITRIQLRCPVAHACDTMSVGGAWTAWADAFDGGGAGLAGYTSTTNPPTGDAIATFVIRDTTVATFTPVGVRVANVSALKSGSTWIVATRGSIADSLRLVVR